MTEQTEPNKPQAAPDGVKVYLLVKGRHHENGFLPAGHYVRLADFQALQAQLAAERKRADKADAKLRRLASTFDQAEAWRDLYNEFHKHPDWSKDITFAGGLVKMQSFIRGMIQQRDSLAAQLEAVGRENNRLCALANCPTCLGDGRIYQDTSSLACPSCNGEKTAVAAIRYGLESDLAAERASREQAERERDEAITALGEEGKLRGQAEADARLARERIEELEYWNNNRQRHIENLLNEKSALQTRLDAMQTEIDELHKELLRFYHADGSWEVMDDNEKVIERRIECAKRLDAYEKALQGAKGALESAHKYIPIPAGVFYEQQTKIRTDIKSALAAINAALEAPKS